MEVSILRCPFCGAGISQKARVCDYCGHEYMISSFSSILKAPRADVNKCANEYSNALRGDPEDPSLNHSAGICYMVLGVYEKALASFEKAINGDPENSSSYYSAAVCMLNGKSAFLLEKKKVDKAIEYLNAALTIEELGTYHYLMAYIKYDFYKRKFLRIEPDYVHHLKMARSIGISDEERRDLFNLLKVEMPEGF